MGTKLIRCKCCEKTIEQNPLAEDTVASLRGWCKDCLDVVFDTTLLKIKNSKKDIVTAYCHVCDYEGGRKDFDSGELALYVMYGKAVCLPCASSARMLEGVLKIIRSQRGKV